MISVPKVSPCLHAMRPACIWLVISTMRGTDAARPRRSAGEWISCAWCPATASQGGAQMMSSGRFQIQRLQRGGCDNPLPPPGATSPPGRNGHRLQLRSRCMASPRLMHSSVLFLFAVMTSVSLVRVLWLFANTADASARTCHVFRSRFCFERKSKSRDMISLSGAARANRTTTSRGGDTGETQGEEMSCDKNRSVSGCVVFGW